MNFFTKITNSNNNNAYGNNIITDYKINRKSILMYILGSFILSRLILYIVYGITINDFSINTIIDNINIYDAAWYRSWIDYFESRNFHFSIRGEVTYNFFPAYPMVVYSFYKLFNGIFSINMCGVIISSIFLIIALYYIYKYVYITNRTINIAHWYVYFMCFGIYSFYFSILYSESMFLMLLIMAFYYMKSHHYIKMGLSVAILGLTRSTGVFFVFVFFIFTILEFQKNSNVISIVEYFKYIFKNSTIICGISLCPLGLFSYMLFLYIKVGDALAFVHSQKGWGRSYMSVLRNFINTFWNYFPIDYAGSILIISFLLVFILLIKYKRIDEAIYPFIVLLINGNSNIIYSTPRYVIGSFTVLLVFIDLLDELPKWKKVIIAIIVFCLEIGMAKFWILKTGALC